MPRDAQNIFNDAAAQRCLRPLDIAFARFLGQIDPHAKPDVLWLAALTSRQLADGHPCLDLNAIDALALEQDWPAHWLDYLRDTGKFTSALVANAAGNPENAPLVLDGHRVYLRRYWRYEQDVAQKIRDRLLQPVATPEGLRETLQRLFTAEDTQQPQWPRVACALAVRSAFTVLTGGPGTGKTTTVVRLLGLLQSLHLRIHDQPLRICVAAPTGKAAARLSGAITTHIAALGVDDDVRASIPQTVTTLHRLLGARLDTRRYAYNRQNPLHIDVLVIDEASMIDLEMMHAVLDALPTRAPLILLGDKDQLSSVEAGAVLGELCLRAAEGHYTQATADWVKELSGDDVSAYVRDDGEMLDQHIATLRISHRFATSGALGQLASAVNAGDAERAMAILDASSTDIAWMPTGDATQTITAMAVDGSAVPLTDTNTSYGYRHYLDYLRRERPAPGADMRAYSDWAQGTLQALSRFQLLCAVKHGPTGTEALNRDIANALFKAGLIETDHGGYEGRPVMVTRNDYNLGLMNGDVGVTLRMQDREGRERLYVAFPVPPDLLTQEPVRFVPVTRLADIETVYAMTVHKSQGSEFEHVALVLPSDDSHVLSREWLYTGITRARRWLSVVSTREAFVQAINQRTRRYSGLAERLGMQH